MGYAIALFVGVMVGAGAGIYVYRTYASKWVAAAQAEVARLQAELKSKL